MMHFPLSRVLLFEFRMVCDHHPALRVTLMARESNSLEYCAPAQEISQFFIQFSVTASIFARISIIAEFGEMTAGIAGSARTAQKAIL